MKVLSVVGARPQFVKLAPVHHALVSRGHNHIIVHTGQHYDYGMSDVFFKDLNIPEPDENLEIGSGSHGRQIGAMLAALEEVILHHQPDWVLVYGDTNSTLAAAIATVKIHIPLAHLEAGLRSFNRRMPEEHNRILTDHAADLLLPPTQVAFEHLQREGLANKAVIVGDVMTDVCYQTRDQVQAQPPEMPTNWDSATDYHIATIHRQENTDDLDRLRMIMSYLTTSDVPVRLLAHPRLKAKIADAQVDIDTGKISTFDPLSYPQLVHAVMHSQGVITDSGGLQKEAFLLQRRCITVRSETEWVETVELGWNTLVPYCDVPIAQVFSVPLVETVDAPYGTGSAATATVIALENAVTSL